MNISLFFFYLSVFALPFFRRLEVLTPYSYLAGKFIDYLTYTTYGFDILLAIALLFWAVEILISKEVVAVGNKKVFFSWLAIIFFSFISLFFAPAPAIGLYYILILFWLLLIYLFVLNEIKTPRRLFILLNVFVFSIFLQGVLAIWQFFKNGSVGLHFLGEQIISADKAGVAKTIINGAKHIRPYGTFSHPNILALFLLVAGLVALNLLFSSKPREISQSDNFAKGKIISWGKDRKYRIYLSLVIAVLSCALLLTFSRIGWIAGLVFWGGYVWGNYKLPLRPRAQGREAITNYKIKLKKVPLYLVIFLVPLLATAVYLAPSIWLRVNPFLGTTWESLDIRSIVLLKSFVLIKSNLLGVGIGNFVIEIARLLVGHPVWMVEPVHNIFVLILAEIGILGLASFLAFLYFVAKNLKSAPLYLKYIFALFIFLMFFDHYFWDLRQAQVLLFLFLGLMGAYSINKEL